MSRRATPAATDRLLSHCRETRRRGSHVPVCVHVYVHVLMQPTCLGCLAKQMTSLSRQRRDV
ncbi:hypothetical protein, partial [Paraburkholderia sp. SIMBA_054]|uniref:hypothetical protein n=1 Tax=Paraburkholderia sp. SIMBA_054 TaxID=3085795 RepID=UPI00397DB2F8